MASARHAIQTIAKIVDKNGNIIYIPNNDSVNIKIEPLTRFSEENDVIEVFVRPIDKDGWIMGEDWLVRVHKDVKFKYLKNIIEDYKKIPAVRQVTKHIRKKMEIEVINDDWSLRRQGALTIIYW